MLPAIHRPLLLLTALAACAPRVYSERSVVASEVVLAAPDSIDPAEAERSVREAMHRAGATGMTVARIPGRNIFRVRSDAAALLAPDTVAAVLRPHLPAAFRAEPNIVFQAAANQDLLGPRNQQQWALRNSGASSGNRGGTPDADVDGFEALTRLVYSTPAPQRRALVAVLDSGVDRTHASLQHALWRNAGEIAGNQIDDDRDGYVDNVDGWDFVTGTPDVTDLTGHGTHVAGIIAARPADPAANAAFGLAPHAQILPLRILAGEQPVMLATLFDVLGAFDFARKHRADIINMSFESYVYSQLLDEEIQRSYAADIMLVAAAGNGRPNGIGVDVTQKPVYPCVLPHVVCVAATGPTDKLSAFSNFGVDPMRPYVTIAAPGEDIWSTSPGNQHRPESGTSMAAPMVAATFAALVSLYPEETRADVRRRVLGAADRIPGLAAKIDEGRRLDVYRALFGPKPLSGSIHARSEYCDTKVTIAGATYPRWQNAPYANSGEPGIDGSHADHAFTICTPQQLIGIRDEDLAKVFHLAQDIDWSQLGPAGGHPIGGGPRAPGQPPLAFTGGFSGLDHAIIGMTMRGAHLGGLFAKLGGRASVLRLELRGVDIEVSGRGGALAASVEGSPFIHQITAEGRVSAGEIAGGLVGEQRGGQINGVFFAGEVASARVAGGIIGAAHAPGAATEWKGWNLSAHVNGTVRAPVAGGIVGRASERVRFDRAHASGFVIGTTAAGGIAGMLSCGATIDTVYATGEIDGTGHAGGLVGQLANGHVVLAYASMFMGTTGATRGGAVGSRTDGERTTVGGKPGPYVCTGTATAPPPSTLTEGVFYNATLTAGAGQGGTGKTGPELRSAATFPAGWFGQFGFVLRPGFQPALDRLPRSFRL